MKNRIGIINGILDGTIPEAEAKEIMRQFAWCKSGVEFERNKLKAVEEKPAARRIKTAKKED